MAKKPEVQNKWHENRNAILTGLLIALLPIIISILLYAAGIPFSAWLCRAYPVGAIRPVVICVVGLLPTLYFLLYLPLGILLYLASLKFDKENRLKLRFWGKSLLAGVLFGLALDVVAVYCEGLLH